MVRELSGWVSKGGEANGLRGVADKCAVCGLHSWWVGTGVLRRPAKGSRKWNGVEDGLEQERQRLLWWK